MEILIFKVYNQDKEEVGIFVIFLDEGVVIIMVDEGIDLFNVFVICIFFFGVILFFVFGGYQDWSGLNKEFIVILVSGKCLKLWIVIFKIK